MMGAGCVLEEENPHRKENSPTITGSSRVRHTSLEPEMTRLPTTQPSLAGGMNPFLPIAPKDTLPGVLKQVGALRKKKGNNAAVAGFGSGALGDGANHTHRPLALEHEDLLVGRSAVHEGFYKIDTRKPPQTPRPNLCTANGSEESEEDLILFTRRRIGSHACDTYRAGPLGEEHGEPTNKMLSDGPSSPEQPPRAGYLFHSSSSTNDEARETPAGLEENEGKNLAVRVRRKSTSAQEPSAAKPSNKEHSSGYKGSNGQGSVRVNGGTKEELRKQRPILEVINLVDDPDATDNPTHQVALKRKGPRKSLRGRYEDQSSLILPASSMVSRIPSGPKPVNKLADSTTAKSAPPTRPVVRKHFDLTNNSLAEEESYSSKRQKTHDASEKDSTTSRTSRGPAQRDERAHSAALSSFSQPHTGQGNRGVPRSEVGSGFSTGRGIREITHVPPGRNRNAGNQKGGAYKNPLILGEDPNDPIDSDQEPLKVLPLGTKPTTTVSVEIPQKVYNGNANLRPARLPKQHSSQLDPITSEGPETSKHFSNKSRGPTSRAKLRQETQDPNESLDDLSADHYFNQANALLSKKQRENLEKTRGQKPLATQSNTAKRRQSQVDLSSDGEHEERGKIHPTNFATPKKNPDEEIYKLTKVFTEKTLWLVENRDTWWYLVTDAKEGSMAILNPQRETQWSSSISRIDKYEYERDGRMLVLHFPRDLTCDVGANFYLELGDAEQVESLRAHFKSVKASAGGISKPSLQDVFSNIIRKTTKYNEGRKTQKPADDIERMVSNKAVRDKARLDATFEKYRPPKPPLLAPKPEMKLANSMRLDANASTAKRNLLPKPKTFELETFYTPSDQQSNASSSTRSGLRASTRQIASRPSLPVRSPTPEQVIERWSHHNTDWQDEWKASLVYPREGKNKATVDKQDIERLDEGEFLNDNLLIFYLRKLEQDLNEQNPEFAKRVYFQNTFFYDRLTKNPPKGKRINYPAVERWTSKVDLFNYDYIVVPVNENAHWYVAIICNVKKFLRPDALDNEDALAQDLLQPEGVATEAEQTLFTNKVSAGMKDMSIEDEMPVIGNTQGSNDELDNATRSSPATEPGPNKGSPSDEPGIFGGDAKEDPIGSDLLPVTRSKQTSTPTRRQKKKSAPVTRQTDTTSPRIITLDSLGLTHQATCTNLKWYMLAEIKAKRHKDPVDPKNIGMAVKHLPQQDNYCDCGLFLLAYVETFLRKGDDFIKGLIQGSQDLDIDWPAASQLRSDIRNLVFELQAEQVSENARLQKEKAEAKKADRRLSSASKSKAKRPLSKEPDDTSKETSVQDSEPQGEPILPRSSKKKVSSKIRGQSSPLAHENGLSATHSSPTMKLGQSSRTPLEEIISLDGSQDDPPPQSYMSRIRNSLKGWGGAPESKPESHQTEVRTQIPKLDVSESIEEVDALEAMYTPVGHKRRKQSRSKSSPVEIPDSPDILKQDHRPVAEAKIQEPTQLLGKSKARSHSPILGDDSKQYQRGGSLNAIDVDEHTIDPDEIIPTDAKKITQENHDGEMLLVAEETNGPGIGGQDNPQLVPDSPEFTSKSPVKNSNRVVLETSSASPRRQQRKQGSSPAAIRSSNPTGVVSPNLRKRKAEADTEEIMEPRPHKSPYIPHDGLEQAMLSSSKRKHTKF